MAGPPDHPRVAERRIGVLLVNLGTPDAPDPAAVRRYLREFLSDRRVVELPRLLWQPILHAFVLTRRPKRSAHAYRQIWREDGSPLAAITAGQAAALADAFGPQVIVDHAMRYGRPAIGDRLRALKAQGCDRILVAPLYPQYCGATTAAAHDAVFAALEAMRWQPALRILPAYHDHPAYIETLRAEAAAQLAALDFVPDAIVASFHGMPRRTLDLGDPYHCQCVKTARLLGEALDRDLVVAFQSRFGRARWLEPATGTVLAGLPARGVKRVAVIAPGFAADCLETLEELDIRGRAAFLKAGGTDFAYLPCLNDRPAGIGMLQNLLRDELAGWVFTA